MSSHYSSFIPKYKNAVRVKNSILCVGLDPALPNQRTSNVMQNKDRMAFMKDIIDSVSPFASCIKMNRQYLIGLDLNQIMEINKLIHEKGMISIIDHKLSDIGSTNDSAIFWFKEEGFDAFTYSPFAGNILEATNAAHELDLGIIVLTLMSNPEAEIQKKAFIDSTPLYLHIAAKCVESKADACVIGATGNVKEQNVKAIFDVLDRENLVLIPGVGAQGGDAEKILKLFGRRAIVNVGRSIIYSSNPKEEAEKYNSMLLSMLD
jgi:orotidine 5'-phosphate decarboxylase subfamily 2